jgi:hypothetical protein
MGAVIAFGRSPLVGVDIEGVIRTCLHARLTADTASIIEIDDPILAGEKCIGWADISARCIFAVVTAMDAEFSR